MISCMTSDCHTWRVQECVHKLDVAHMMTWPHMACASQNDSNFGSVLESIFVTITHDVNVCGMSTLTHVRHFSENPTNMLGWPINWPSQTASCWEWFSITLWRPTFGTAQRATGSDTLPHTKDTQIQILFFWNLRLEDLLFGSARVSLPSFAFVLALVVRIPFNVGIVDVGKMPFQIATLFAFVLAHVAR